MEEKKNSPKKLAITYLDGVPLGRVLFVYFLEALQNAG